MTATSRCRRYSLALLLVVGLVPTATALAATYNVAPFTISISDAIPASEKIRGVIDTSRWNPMVTEANGKAEFDAFIVEQRLATITSGFSDQDLTLDQIVAQYQSLVAAFETIAVRANRPELRYAGFIFQGCSVHGARSMSEGFGNPDRTIAVISFCGRNYALFTLLPSFSAFMPELSFPHLQVSNGSDLDRVTWNDATTRQVRSEARGLWTSSLHPRLGHCEAAADGLKYELLWLREAIKARVPATIPDGAYALTKLSDTNGWLGDYTPVRSTDSASVWGDGYRFSGAKVFAGSSVPAADVNQYIWFPTRVAAEEWKNYADTGACCLGVTEPPPTCGDGQCTAGAEDCGLCPADCPCATGEHCQGSQCTLDTVATPPAPDCAAATVTPLSGDAPLALHLDATGCRAAPGQALAFEWQIQEASSEVVRYTTALATHTATVPGTLTVVLSAWDAAASAARTTNRFTVVVREPSPASPADSDPAAGQTGASLDEAPAATLGVATTSLRGCAASGTSLVPAFAALLGLLRRKRR
jgi:hypothetical protein